RNRMPKNNVLRNVPMLNVSRTRRTALSPVESRRSRASRDIAAANHCRKPRVGQQPGRASILLVGPAMEASLTRVLYTWMVRHELLPLERAAPMSAMIAAYCARCAPRPYRDESSAFEQ